MAALRLFLLSFLLAKISSAYGTEDDSEVGASIVGGQDASPGEYPFMVQWSGCGASLISPDMLLTAAHCDVLSSPNVLVGAYKSQNVANSGFMATHGGITPAQRTIAQRFKHELYNSDTFQNDFLLLKLDQPVLHIPPVKLNTRNDIPADYDPLFVMGFGQREARVAIDYGSSSTTVSSVPVTAEEILAYSNPTLGDDGFDGRADISVLQEVLIETIPYSLCSGPSMYGSFINDDLMICAGFQRGGQDACYGDSGGPLVQRVGGEFVQVGVVSFGVGCARANRPGVYSRVSGEYDWIQEKLCSHSDYPPTSCPGSAAAETPPPTAAPTATPSKKPTKMPTSKPTPMPTRSPTKTPSQPPTKAPTMSPSDYPTRTPSDSPTKFPTKNPTIAPSPSPSGSSAPSNTPSSSPTETISPTLSYAPTAPTGAPSGIPSDYPSLVPSNLPSLLPSNVPTLDPSAMPSTDPTSIPSDTPSDIPTEEPTSSPTPDKSGWWLGGLKTDHDFLKDWWN